ncbi:MAG: hypothetical protein AB7N70_40070 [Dehalococcoidia bacterium]
MDTRALFRISLVLGIIVLVSSVIAVREFHTEDRGLELALIAGIAAGGFFLITGLAGVLAHPPRTEEEEAEAAAVQQLTSERPAISVTAAMGLYVLVLSVIGAIIVGIALDDFGAGIQTFVAGLILGGVIYGAGLLLGLRPTVEEEG